MRRPRALSALFCGPRVRHVTRAWPAALVPICLVLSGCVSLGEDNGPPPDAMSDEIVAARERASAQADRALTEAATALDGRILARTTTDACYEGENNYKRREGYDHRCTLRRAAVVGFDGDFRKRIAAFDRELFAAGWDCPLPCSETNSDLVEEYWEFRKPEYGGNDPPISILPTTGPYGRDGLYLGVGYVSDSHRSGRAVLDDWHRRRRGGLFESYEQSRPLDVDAVLARVARFDYAVALAVETDYFEDDDIG